MHNFKNISIFNVSNTISITLLGTIANKKQDYSRIK